MDEVSTLEVRRAPLRITVNLEQTTKDRLDKTGLRTNATVAFHAGLLNYGKEITTSEDIL